MDTLLYDWSIPAISSLQGTFANQAKFMQFTSVLFDPKYAFLIYSPLAYLLDKKVGKKLILTTVIAEWLNQILKWLLHGERPYWYVHSSGHFNPQETPIKQFPITCELGPGHPSGHAMVTAAVWFIILDSLLQFYQKNLSAQPKKSVKVGAWFAYALLLSTVSVSRVFLGCHFPHQCLAGAILGLILAKQVSKLNVEPVHLIATSLFVLLTAFGSFGLLQALGFDPSWTIGLAMKHCAKREYIHLDTAPFFSVMRYSAFALGSGLGLWLPLNKVTPMKNMHLSIRLLMALLMARAVDNLGLYVSAQPNLLFYSSAYFAYTLFPFLFINL